MASAVPVLNQSAERSTECGRLVMELFVRSLGIGLGMAGLLLTGAYALL